MAGEFTQKNRPLSLQTPLGEDVLLLRSLRLVERLNTPFSLTLQVCSEKSGLAADDLLGGQVTVKMKVPGGGTRYFHGVVAAFHQTGYLRPLAEYEVQVVPWLWLLGLSSDCRIYQKQTLPEVVQSVFREQGFTSYSSRLTATYPAHGVVTQYRETHLAFVQRLLEKEGIGYYFEHSENAHQLILFDNNDALDPLPGYESIPFSSEDAGYEGREYIREWRFGSHLATGKWSLGDYDYIAPKNKLAGSASGNQGCTHGDRERYDWPGGYDASMDPNHYATLRAEEAMARRAGTSGEAACFGMGAGHIFRLQHLPQEEQNTAYLTTSLEMEVESADFLNRQGSEDFLACRVAFECLPKEVTYRPPLVTPQPRIAGVQSATVTGPSGQDPKIPYVSALGSIKVRFYWDRAPSDPENTSGWVRVSQVSAGPSYGSVFNPRIGNEVLVAFEEGDPDRPIVVGRVYNADQQPALSLPQFAQRSYFCDDAGNAIAFTPEKNFESVVIFSPYKETLRVIGATPDQNIDPNIILP